MLGGVGRDQITSGSGNDQIDLSGTSTGDFDTLSDFNVADDTLLISGNEFGSSLALGTLDASFFRIGTKATTADDRFIYDQSKGNLFFDADGVGGAAQVQIAKLSNKAALTNADFVVVS